MPELEIRKNILKYLHEKGNYVSGGELADKINLKRDELKVHLDFLETKGYLKLNGAVGGISHISAITEKGKKMVENNEFKF
ncbi:conserved hypothetical protein [Methanococcus maripaludis C5]|uniref:Uncharacterized protein n=1 Tax=Methanococcus maripaludis (strain C5 / ATCC BAA-1333) TaxID=402880 RepID=A4FYH0_METM5|nr:winged helix-turn-helix transcriptional regulator [Methanococcus maripaludis]ABO35254.1 conserved hypothetical protein [Methanococcus maripaludis C5]